MTDAVRKRRRVELRTLWATNPEQLVAMYLRVTGVKLPRQLPPGMVVARLISAIIENEPEILRIENQCDPPRARATKSSRRPVAGGARREASDC